MKFLKLVQYDLGRNLLTKPIRWGITAALFALLYLIFSLDVMHWHWVDADISFDIRKINLLGLSFGDVIVTQLGGMLPIIFVTLEDSFVFPVKWLLPHMLALFFTLSYTSGDLAGSGLQVLTRAQNKRAWWLSKCLWNILTVFLCFAVGEAVLYLFTVIGGNSGGFSLNSDVFTELMREYLPAQTATAGEYFLSLCVMPAAVCAAVSLIQMMLTLYVKPVIAYIIVCVYYIAGAYYAHPLLISNYAMTVRSAAIGFYNFRADIGLGLCALFAVAVAVIGARRLNRMDLVGNVVQ